MNQALKDTMYQEEMLTIKPLEGIGWQVFYPAEIKPRRAEQVFSALYQAGGRGAEGIVFKDNPEELVKKLNQERVSQKQCRQKEKQEWRLRREAFDQLYSSEEGQAEIATITTSIWSRLTFARPQILLSENYDKYPFCSFCNNHILWEMYQANNANLEETIAYALGRDQGMTGWRSQCPVCNFLSR